MDQPRSFRAGQCEFELKYQGTSFLGIGEVRIAGSLVRSGSLPMRPTFTSHLGLHFDHFVLEQIETRDAQSVVLHTTARAQTAPVFPVQDHSLDPVWSDQPWDGRELASVPVDWVFEAAEQQTGDLSWNGFTYQFRVDSPTVSLYAILDRTTWELDGRAAGITLLRQQMGEDPVVTLDAQTEYSTSACIKFPLNPIMTYDVPRWASEQGFDYQYRGDAALIGKFTQCGLIRTIVVRNAGDGEIRHFDKHIFDETHQAMTVPKFIGLNRAVGDDIAHLNAWTRVYDADQDLVLGEFGMHRTTPKTTLSHNFWNNFDCNSYREDLLPAAAALGFQQIFIDPYWENDMTRGREGVLPPWCSGNMCCPHEYEVAKVLGGVEGYRKLADDARAEGVDLLVWIGSHQSQNSPYLNKHHVEVIKGPDGRHYYGSGYDAIYGMDISSPFGPMFQDAVLRGARDTGAAGFMYDSYYNFGWMPINFHTPDPEHPQSGQHGTLKAHTQWRQLAEIMAAWQKAGLHMVIESLGPWGQPQHGVQGNYYQAGGALAYQCAVSIGYSVIPAPATAGAKTEVGPEFYFKLLAHKAPNTLSLWNKAPDGSQQRIDHTAAPVVRQANLAYRRLSKRMYTRTILPGEAGVLWTDQAGKVSALYSFGGGAIQVPSGTKWVNMQTSQPAEVTSGAITTEPWQVYEADGK